MIRLMCYVCDIILVQFTCKMNSEYNSSYLSPSSSPDAHQNAEKNFCTAKSLTSCVEKVLFDK